MNIVDELQKFSSLNVLSYTSSENFFNAYIAVLIQLL